MADYTSPTERIAIAVEKIADEQRRQTEVLERIAAEFRDEDDEKAAEARYEGTIDTREDVAAPARCPACASLVEYYVETGETVLSKSDADAMAEIGITKPGRYKTLSLGWRCHKYPAEHNSQTIRATVA